MKKSLLRKLIFTVALLMAVAFLVYGNLRQFKVYDAETEEFGIESFQWIKGYELVVDATFTGTIRKENKLYSTYDRSQPVGKRECPT